MGRPPRGQARAREHVLAGGCLDAGRAGDQAAGARFQSTSVVSVPVLLQSRFERYGNGRRLFLANARLGGTKSSRYGIGGDIAWFEGNSGQTTHEVARKQLNGCWLYDMLGNVWQWVEDWCGPYEPGQKVDPSGPPMGSDRTLRGGSWDKFPRSAPVSDRGKDEPGNRNNDMGFRCVGDRLDAIEK